MTKRAAWSYSALTAFETCPRRYHLTRVTKEIVEPETEVLRWGNAVHKALENRVKDGTPLPDTMAQWEALVLSVLAKEGEVLAEQQLCINASLSPTGWLDKDAWCRGVIDLLVINGDKAAALDWKTGKPKHDHDQLSLFAALLFHHYPQLDQVTTGYVWLKEYDKGVKFLSDKTFKRSDLPAIWSVFLPRVKRLDIAFANDKWLPNPSGLCKGWCPCSECEFFKSK